MNELSKELERLFGKLKFICKCNHCNHEWVYIPRGLPSRYVTCPKCRRKISLLLYCKLLQT